MLPTLPPMVRFWPLLRSVLPLLAAAAVQCQERNND
jgi:hypothetical protein